MKNLLRSLAGTLLVLAILATAFPGSTLAFRPQDNGARARVAAYLGSLEQAGFFGSVLIESRGSTLLARGYGYADVARGLKNTPRTLFDIGSITKQFTATAILALELEGKLSTNDQLSRFFPSVPADKASITIHQLLRHASGLRGGIGRDYEAITRAAFVDSVFRSPLRFPPGTAFSYSNIGYSLLGMIVEKASGMPYEDYLYEKLWHPAGMEQTGYRRPPFDTSMIAVGYDATDSTWGKPTWKMWDADGPYWHLKGNGGILSTVEDMARWDRALSGDRILPPQAKAKLFHPPLRDGEDSSSYYAYGWDVHRSPGGSLTYWHNGTNGIFYADFYRLVDDSATVILLSNKANGIGPVGREISQWIMDPGSALTLPVLESRANRDFTEGIIRSALAHGVDEAARIWSTRAKGIGLLENRVNERAYELLNARSIKEAITLFQLNVLAYPDSWNAYDSLGEAYLAAGNNLLAEVNYRKSLALHPGNDNAKRMLEQIKGK
jgi:CubicO group peptidase (beta-lactamase class C family)